MKQPQCFRFGSDEHGITRRCVMPLGHEDQSDGLIAEHLFWGEVPNIILQYDQGDGLGPSISEDSVGKIVERLNEDCERYIYSHAQVRAALWKLLERKIEDILEYPEDYWDELTPRDAKKLLGEPERDLVAEQKDAEQRGIE